MSNGTLAMPRDQQTDDFIARVLILMSDAATIHVLDRAFPLVMMTHMYTRMCFRSSLSLGDVDSQYWLGIDEQHSPGVWRWITGFPATWIG